MSRCPGRRGCRGAGVPGLRGAGEAISVHQLLLGAFRCPDRPIIATEWPICTRKPLVCPIWWSTNPCEPATGRQCPLVGPLVVNEAL